jgi:hypothetical protein
MSKFLLNLLLQISKALVNSKIKFLIQKLFFLTFGPADLAVHSAFGQASPRIGHVDPPSPRIGHVVTGIRFPFCFARSELAASPSSLCQAVPGYQLRPPPPAARAHPHRHSFPATERCPVLRLGCQRAITTSPSFPSLNSPLKPSPVFNGVKAINAGVNPPGTPLLSAPPTHIKSEHHPRSSPHLSQPLFTSLHARASLSPSTAAADSAPPSPSLHAATRAPVRP